MVPPQLPFEVLYELMDSPVFNVLPAEVDVISPLLLILTQAPSILKSRLAPVLFQTRYAARPT